MTMCASSQFCSAGIFDMARSDTHVAHEDAAIKEADVQTRTRCMLNALVCLLEGACGPNYPQTKDFLTFNNYYLYMNMAALKP